MLDCCRGGTKDRTLGDTKLPNIAVAHLQMLLTPFRVILVKAEKMHSSHLTFLLLLFHDCVSSFYQHFDDYVMILKLSQLPKVLTG